MQNQSQRDSKIPSISILIFGLLCVAGSFFAVWSSGSIHDKPGTGGLFPPYFSAEIIALFITLFGWALIASASIKILKFYRKKNWLFQILVASFSFIVCLGILYGGIKLAQNQYSSEANIISR